MGKKDEILYVLIHTSVSRLPESKASMASQQFDLIRMMKKSPLEGAEWGLGKSVSNTLCPNKITSIGMGWVGSGVEQQWHCFWPVDDLEVEKPIAFVEVYRELNLLMGEMPLC